MGPRRTIVLSLLCALVAGPVGEARPSPPQRTATGGPFTFVVHEDVALAKPPGARRTRRELASLARSSHRRTKRQERIARRWERGATMPWTRLVLRMITVHRPAAFPTRSARALGLLHVGMHDAMAIALAARAEVDRPRPFARGIDPMFRSSGSAYPDIVSAIGGAAETILTYLFPGEDPSTFRRLARQAGRSRLWAGVNYPSDVRAGRTLGRRVGALVVAHGEQDGHADPPTDILAARPCEPSDCSDPDQQHWVPTSPSYQYPPSDPSTSRWDPYLMSSPDQFRPGPPPAYGSQPFMDAHAEMKTVNDSADEGLRELAVFWDDGPGTFSPGGHWNDIALDIVRHRRIGTVKTARLFALMNAAIVDAFAAAWDAKYAYWSIRPISVIRERPTILGSPNPLYDPGWLPNVTTPPFPAYPSGHAAESAAAARVLQHFLGGRTSGQGLAENLGVAGPFDEIADQVALSRMSGGIHVRYDNETALVLGRRIAGLGLHLAANLGWRPIRRAARVPGSARP